MPNQTTAFQAKASNSERTRAYDRSGTQATAVSGLDYGLDFVDQNLTQSMEENKPNQTGLPDKLKTGIESLSGLSMGDVRVHYNSPKPAQLQALAYTQGTEIHVGPGQGGYLPHEAWHVVQQKQGRVQPNIYVQGTAVNNNTGLEHEAETMGGIVSRSSLGNEAFGTFQKQESDFTPPSYGISMVDNHKVMASPPTVQGKFRLTADQASRTVQTGGNTKFHHMEKGDHNFLADPADKAVAKIEGPTTIPSLDISDDGKLAVEARKQTVKVMFASEIDTHNQALKAAQSAIRLEKGNMTLEVPSINGSQSKLFSVTPKNITNESSGLKMTAPQQCIEMAEAVISNEEKGDANYQFQMNVPSNCRPKLQREGLNNTIASMVYAYVNAKKVSDLREDWLTAAKKAADDANNTPQVDREKISELYFDLELSNPNDLDQVNDLQKAIKEYKHRGELIMKSSPYELGEKVMTVTMRDNRPNNQAGAVGSKSLEQYYSQILAGEPFKKYLKKTLIRRMPRVKYWNTIENNEGNETYVPKLKKAMRVREAELIVDLKKLTQKELLEVFEDLGLNESVELEIGQAFGITAVSNETLPYPYHWAGVVAKSGKDVVTLENYAREEGATVAEDGRWYFQMYGAASQVDVSADDKLSVGKSDDPDFWKAGTFHGTWKQIFKDAIPFTVGVGKKSGQVTTTTTSKVPAD